ncbi:MAG: GNAT family N-acetyltransferase [Calditrichaeota bacterium]|nr:GNAT family N-acetyltransferase [Calditrichota bacterium]
MRFSAEDIFPLTPERWDDFLQLFGPRGACGGCFCMWWRLSAREFENQKGDGNREAMKQLVFSGIQPGILLYIENKAIGWCSLGPRDHFPRLQRSRILKPIDNLPVWSIVCFFIHKNYRRKGMSSRLLNGAIELARSNNARIIEAYPIDTIENYPAAFAFTGIAGIFRKAGFKEVARRSPKRPIMRLKL